MRYPFMMCGVDEAGRGPVMGPLVVCAVFIEDDAALKDLGVKDSKKLTPKAREKLYDRIIETIDDYHLEIASAAEIDEMIATKSLNTIELEMFARSVSKRPVSSIYADCPDVNESRFSSQLSSLTGGEYVIGKHKADDTYPVVSAASILAKVTRDRMIDDIADRFGMDIGSGYPSDRKTMGFIENWIRKNGSSPPDVRNSWEPVKKLLMVSKNTRITDW